MTSLDIRPPILDALRQGRPVVALESTLISHGLPWPTNLETACAAESAVRHAGAVPATIGVVAGRPTVGLDSRELERLANSPDVRKASRRDLGVAVAQGATAATTVSATMLLADKAGIRVFATGGIGGVHPATDSISFDVSADLIELGQTPVCVVCSGGKSVLDLSATLELLETHGVPVVGYRTDAFPAFYLRDSGLPVSARVDSPREAADVLAGHWALSNTGVVLAQPVEAIDEVDPGELRQALAEAKAAAHAAGVRGAALTPFLLTRLAKSTTGRTLRANVSLVVANAALAAEVAVAFTRGAPGIS